MRVRDPPIYAAVFYFILFSSLIVHEFGHVYAAQYITRDCLFTESHLVFDLLVLRRSGMTYFTCGYGVIRYEDPVWGLDLSDPSAPLLSYKSAQAKGVKQITSPLSTGWFTALMGPALELAYITWVVHWLSRRFKNIRAIRACYLIFLFMLFVGSYGDFRQAIPDDNMDLFITAYILTFVLVALTHVSLNIGYYRGLSRSTRSYLVKQMTLK